MRIVFYILIKQTQNDLNRNVRMENQFNKKHGAGNRIFNTGSLVYAKNFKRNQSFWVSGKIIERVANAVYNSLISKF